MACSVTLDTSYLITLANRSRPNHEIARRYWRYFVENNVVIYLSVIVASEFSLKQEIPPDLLRSCRILPFNWNDAMKTAEMNFSQFKEIAPDRVALKDEIKIIAQAVNAGASHLITEDAEMLRTYLTKLRLAGMAQLKIIKLDDGFDSSHFTDGQREMTEGFGKDIEPGSDL